MQMLSIDAITLDERCQPRSAMSLELIGDYARAMAEGAEFPPLTVYRDGSTYYLADGFHRIAAAQDAGQKHMVCDVRPGDIRDAILHAVGANATHGQRRTNQDKRRAVETLLNDPEWVEWSDHKIACTCAVSPTTVGTIRSSLSKVDSDASGTRTYTTKHGNTATMNTANIGRRTPVAALNRDDPDVDTDTGEIVGYEPTERVPAPPAPRVDRLRMVATGLIQANGVSDARKIADAIYDMTGGRR